PRTSRSCSTCWRAWPAWTCAASVSVRRRRPRGAYHSEATLVADVRRDAIRVVHVRQSASQRKQRLVAFVEHVIAADVEPGALVLPDRLRTGREHFRADDPMIR